MKHIPKRNITFIDTKNPYVWSMCALSDDEIMFAVDNAAPHVLSLHTAQWRPLASRDPVDIRNVYKVAFDAHTDTLLFLMKDANEYKLVTLCRNTSNASEWLQVESISTNISVISIAPPVIAMCDSRVLLVELRRATVYVLVQSTL